MDRTGLHADRWLQALFAVAVDVAGERGEMHRVADRGTDRIRRVGVGDQQLSVAVGIVISEELADCLVAGDVRVQRLDRCAEAGDDDAVDPWIVGADVMSLCDAGDVHVERTGRSGCV